MGYLIVAAYLGLGIYFNYTPGDWVVGAVIWGIVYFSGATDNLSDSHKKIDNKAIKSEPEVASAPPKQVKENPHKIDSIESANKFEKHYLEETLKTLPKVFSEEYRQVNEVFGDFHLKEKMRLEKLGDDNIKDTIHDLVSKLFGIKVANVKGRLSKPGWLYAGPTKVKCDICSSQLEVFRKPYTAKENVVYRYYALVCLECLTVITPTDFADTGKRRELYKEHKIDTHESSSNDKLERQKSSVTLSKLKTDVAPDYFKIESYPTVRVVNAQWLGGVQEIQNIRNENIKNNREINSGIPISLEEVDLFISWVESGKSLLEIQNFFQRKIGGLEKFVSKDGGKREGLANRCRVTSWNESQKPKLGKKSTVLLNKKVESLNKTHVTTAILDDSVVNALVENEGLDDQIQNPCLDCECEIPQVRLDRIPGAIRCASCQSEFEKDNPNSVARKVKETLGTREDFKNMRKRQYGINIKNKS